MSNEIKQTAVEKFIEKLRKLAYLNNENYDTPQILEVIREAKEMEKEQMIKFARFVLYEAKPTWDGVTTELTVEQYYNANYGGNK
jgi:hypothetical protein